MLCACSHAPLEIKTAVTDLQKPETTPKLPLPAPIQVLPVRWSVVTTDPQSPQYCLSPKGYENLSIIQADTLRWTKEAKWQLDYYRGDHSNGQ